jgi:hypothetical protein
MFFRSSSCSRLACRRPPRYAQKELTHMQALEPLSLSFATAILLASALVAIGIPAVRASGIQPMEMLRRD